MSGYELSVSVRGTREEVEARVVRALRAQGFGVLDGRAELPGGNPPCEVVVGETGGHVTVSIHEREPVADVIEAATAGKVAALAPEARGRLRAALASLEGEP
jgi:uncharacterized protein (DUF302 family)